LASKPATGEDSTKAIEVDEVTPSSGMAFPDASTAETIFVSGGIAVAVGVLTLSLVTIFWLAPIVGLVVMFSGVGVGIVGVVVVMFCGVVGVVVVVVMFCGVVGVVVVMFWGVGCGDGITGGAGA